MSSHFKRFSRQRISQSALIRAFAFPFRVLFVSLIVLHSELVLSAEKELVESGQDAAVKAVSEVAIGQSVPRTSDYFFEILLSLILVLAIIFFSAWLLRRYGRFPGVADGNLRVLGALSVGQRERILLLQVGNEQLLVGVTSSRITNLHQLTTPIEVPSEQNTLSNRLLKESGFAQKLQEAMQASKSGDKTMTNQADAQLDDVDAKKELPAGMASDCASATQKEKK